MRVDHGGFNFGYWLVSLPQLRRIRGPKPPPDPVDSSFEPPADVPAVLAAGSWALQPLFIALHCSACAVASKYKLLVALDEAPPRDRPGSGRWPARFRLARGRCYSPSHRWFRGGGLGWSLHGPISAGQSTQADIKDHQITGPEPGSPMLGLCLDLLTRGALTAAAGPVPYTEAMAAEDDGLLADVTVDSQE